MIIRIVQTAQSGWMICQEDRTLILPRGYCKVAAVSGLTRYSLLTLITLIACSLLVVIGLGSQGTSSVCVTLLDMFVLNRF